MTRDETKQFIAEIVGVYPRFQVMPGTIDAWAKRLTDCSLERARELLDRHMTSDDSKVAPQLDYFMKGMRPVAKNLVESDERLVFHIGLRPEDVPPGCDVTHIGKGCLFDQYGREYGSHETDLPYYYDEMGRICNGLGRVIQE